jgi:TolB protein
LAVTDVTTGERRQYEQAGSIALSWSPTRDQIAYTSGTVDDHPLWGPLNILDVVTGQIRVLSQQTVIAFFWSPDGRSIAFITLNGSQEDDDAIAAGPEKVRRVSRMADNIQQPPSDFLSLSVVDVTTGRGLRLLDFTPTPIFIGQFLPYFDQYALSHRLWSPDSRSILLPVRENGLNLILVIPVAGGRPERLAEGDIAFWSHR